VVIRAMIGLCIAASVAWADHPQLTAARRAVQDVRYDDARGLLVAALAAGAATPEELREIYQLSAATAVVLGQRELAEQYYRRVLALDPEAQLPADASPKLRPPFVAAQAYMAAHRRLAVRAERRGGNLTVTVVADPLGMIAAVAAVVAGQRERGVAVASGPVGLEPRGDVDHIAVLDEHGNTLRRIDPPAATVEAAPRAPAAPPAAPRTPILRRWLTWAIPAVLAGGIGAGFLIDGRNAKRELDAILARNDTYFFDEAERQRVRWQDDTRIATLAFAAAGGFAAAAIIMAATQPSTDAAPVVAPTISARQVGLAWTTRF
jgi:hypothetical protein